MAGLPLEKLTASDLPDKLSISCHDFSAHGDDTRTSLDGPALERAVINVHMMGRCRNHATELRIKDHEVGVGARLNGTFARKQVELLRHLGAGDVHKRMQINFPRLHTMGVE